jgi:peptidylprolyl isomerase
MNTMKKLLVLLLGLCALPAFTTTVENDWRVVDPENTLYLQTNSGRVVFELAEFFAPRHVERIKKLVREGFYNDLSFYRVIDGFVVQGGNNDGTRQSQTDSGPMKAEFSRPITKNSIFILAQSPEFFAEQTGFIQGFPVARDLEKNIEYLVHCRGSMNLARGNPADSGTTDFAIMMGQATRHLDNNMSQFARAIWGLEHLARVSQGDKIIRADIAADLPKEQRTELKIMKVNSTSFQAHLEFYRYRDRSKFFVNPTAHVIDVCYAKTPVKLLAN